MNKLIFTLLLLHTVLFARFDANPTKECPAYNNMKHTSNTHGVVLDTSKKYTVLKKHKGQYLVLLKGEQVAQRWVDGDCFLSKRANTQNTQNIKHISKSTALPSPKKALAKQTTSKNLLALSWHNTFCQTHQRRKECKQSLFSTSKNNKYAQSHFILHGLWPQPRDNFYCNVSKEDIYKDKNRKWHKLDKLDLNSQTRDKLSKYMPGYSSNLHKHEWIKHGTCYGKDANEYFGDALGLVEQINSSKVGQFFTNNIGKKITIQQVKALFNRTFGAGSAKKVELKCRGGLVTELWLHLGSGSSDLKELLKSGKEVRSSCRYGILDKAGF